MSEEKGYGVSVKVNDKVLVGVQSLITALELSALNGTVKTTAGLSNPYSPIYLKAEYAGGERIYFCVNGNPQLPWCSELAEYVLQVFEEYGETSVLPKRESLEIIRFDITYFDGELNHTYCNVIMPDDTVKLLKSKYDCKNNKTVYEEYISIPETYYCELENFLKDVKVYTLINGSGGFP